MLGYNTLSPSPDPGTATVGIFADNAALWAMESIPKAKPETTVTDSPARPAISSSHTDFPYDVYLRAPTTQRYFSVSGNTPRRCNFFGGSAISRNNDGNPLGNRMVEGNGIFVFL